MLKTVDYWQCRVPVLNWLQPFNLTSTQGNIALNYTTTQPALQQYPVDNEGNINFPVLGQRRGELHVGGLLTKSS